MVNILETKRGPKEPLPLWIPETVRGAVTLALAKEPINLLSANAVRRHLVSEGEVEDVRGIINGLRSPILVGLYGSRATLSHNPLFTDEEDFDLYYERKVRRDKQTREEYLSSRGLSLRDYATARKLLETGEFTAEYMTGHRYPPKIVELLVRDIDLLIITGDGQFYGGPRIGKRTNVQMDLDVVSPQTNFDFDLEDYVKFGVAQTIPLIY